MESSVSISALLRGRSSSHGSSFHGAAWVHSFRIETSRCSIQGLTKALLTFAGERENIGGAIDIASPA